jgi:hypothetical protein
MIGKPGRYLSMPEMEWAALAEICDRFLDLQGAVSLTKAFSVNTIVSKFETTSRWSQR